MSLNVRLAIPSDREEVLKFCYNFYQQTAYYPVLTYDRTKVDKLFDMYVNDGLDNVAFIVLANESDVPVGLIIGYVGETPFGYDKLACELAWWVEPEYRGSRMSGELVFAYETWAKTIGCQHATMALLPGLTNPKVEAYYERLGFKKTEISYMKVL